MIDDFARLIVRLCFFSRRTVWWPTWLGWLCLLPVVAALPALWFVSGESFLSVTQRLPADVLVVEGWIRRDGVRAAKDEFERGGYRYLVVTGGFNGEGWVPRRRNYASMAEEELLRLNFPADQIVVAQSRDSDRQRTYESALATKQALMAKGINPAAINVLTRGGHSRRSRIVFSKVLGSATRVGIISWNPLGSCAGPWWRSSERSKELIAETAAYVFEVVFGSGRWAQAEAVAGGEQAAQIRAMP